MGILYLYTIPDQSRGCSTGMLWYKPQGMAINDAFIGGSPSVRASRANDSRFKSTPRTFGGWMHPACMPASPNLAAADSYTFPMGTWQAASENISSFLFAGVTRSRPRICNCTILVSFHCIHPLFPLCPLNFHC